MAETKCEELPDSLRDLIEDLRAEPSLISDSEVLSSFWWHAGRTGVSYSKAKAFLAMTEAAISEAAISAEQ